MWPGDQQSGGEPYPQGTPPQQAPQPGPYGQPGPYQGPEHPQASPYAPPPQPYGQQPPAQGYPQPNPYAQPAGYPPPAPQQPGPQPGYPQQPGHPGYGRPPGGYPPPQQWGQPGPGGPQPPRGKRGPGLGIAIAAAVAVIAVVAAGAVYLTDGDGKKDEAGKDATPSASATTPRPTATTPSPTATATAPGTGGGSDDSPRGAPGSVDVKPVIPGWQVVKRGERNVAFDVPPGWTVGSEGVTIGFADKSGNPAVAMSAPAYYKHDWCRTGSGTADRAAVGTKGANGAKSVRNAAEVQAEAWAYWAYQDNGKGTFSKALNSRAFHNAHGITGWQAQATASDIPRSSKCSADGAAYTVAWTDPTQSDPTKRLVVWVLYCDRGVADALPESTISRIESTIRLIRKP